MKSLITYINENKKVQYSYSIVLKNKKILDGQVEKLSYLKNELKNYNKRDITYIEILNPLEDDFILYPVMCGGDKEWYYKLYSERKNITDTKLDREKMQYKDLNKIIDDLEL
jgi:hypothetical protein